MPSQFQNPPCTNYSLPGVTEHFVLFQHYLRYIRGLPINDTPEIFALHDNANITFAQNETFSLLQGILKMQPRSSTSAGRSREEVCYFKRELCS